MRGDSVEWGGMGMGLGPFQSEQTQKEVVPDQAVKKLPQGSDCQQGAWLQVS